MRLSNFMVLFFPTALIYWTVQSSALNCYHCNSHQNSSCGDPFENDLIDPGWLIDCDSPGSEKNYTYCRKTTQMVYQTKSSTIRIFRNCGYLKDKKFKEGNDPQDACYRKSGTSGVILNYCACHENECNSANWRGPGGKAIVFACVFLILCVFRCQ